MSIEIKMGGYPSRKIGEIERRAIEYLKVIKQTKEYLEYGKEIGCSVAAMVHDAIKWDPSKDKNLEPNEVAEIEKIMKQGKCNELNLKNSVVKDIFDEVTMRAETYIEIFENRKNYLKYGLEKEWAVAHALAQSGYWYPEMDKNLSEEDIKEILKWRSKLVGMTVAHLIAQKQKAYGEALWSIKDLDILGLEDNPPSNSLVAFELISGMWKNTIYNETGAQRDHYYLPPWMKDENGNPDMEILSLKNSKGETVAYHYAKVHSEYWLCDDINILKLDDGKGTTVAHKLAQNCSSNHRTTKDPRVLSLKNKKGVSVEQILKEKGCI